MAKHTQETPEQGAKVGGGDKRPLMLRESESFKVWLPNQQYK